MANNKLTDLNDHLFKQMERLNDENLTEEKMELEIRKAKAVSQISSEIIKGAKIVLDATRLASETGTKFIPQQFGLNQNNK